MTTLESPRRVIGGVDTHGDVHVAAAVDEAGGVLGTSAFATHASGYRDLHAWLCAFGQLERVGIEGTGAYGAGLARHLAHAGVAVLDVERPNRQVRRRQGKSDTLDAIVAARTALSGAAGPAKARAGVVESIRVLLVAHRSATQARNKALVQMRQLLYCGPDELRERFAHQRGSALVTDAARLRPGPHVRDVTTATKCALKSLAMRIERLDAERGDLLGAIDVLTQEAAPALRSLRGVGPLIAGTLLVTAGDNPERLKSEAAFAHLCGVAPLEASSGKVSRHRLDRGGDRQANSALWRVVLVRMTCDQRTRDYVERRTKEGRSTREVMRCLKRYVAREVYHHLPHD